ncbi:uncharacterized protein PSFLO_02905 [Pseudozyma flocculosa]|uniref:Uncharacterized protein n=1 Tax=Pseudozyma flocculosa TaxID=84751 RepID=A0A5C3EZC9_9BASI|nr:uncharacterized protein PSFLO_02905 [Pseudozyma flocculosa]
MAYVEVRVRDSDNDEYDDDDDDDEAHQLGSSQQSRRGWAKPGRARPGPRTHAGASPTSAGGGRRAAGSFSPPAPSLASTAGQEATPYQRSNDGVHTRQGQS